MSGALRLSSRRTLNALLCGVCALSIHTAKAAEPTEPEQMYERLKDAEKHADRLLGDRWNKLVRQRQWVDKSGKFKTYARYVDHDQDLQSVTLLILVKKGEAQEYKEATIPLVKLSKNDQAIVKRIAVMRTQVEEALADAPALDGAATGEMEYAEGVRFNEPQGAEELAAEIPPPPAHLAAMAMMEPWRTDFAAFASSVYAQPNELGQTLVSWSALPQFAEVHQLEQVLHQLRTGIAGEPLIGSPRFVEAPPRPDIEAPAATQEQSVDAKFAQPAPVDPGNGVPRSTMFMLGAKYGWARSGLGEVSWETTIQAAPEQDQPLQHDLQLTSPLTLELLPDKAAAKEFAGLKPGERIRFVGRFDRLGGFDDPPKIVLKVRPVPKAASTAAAERAGSLYGRELSP